MSASWVRERFRASSVMDAETPVPNATVTLNSSSIFGGSKSATTDGAGHYSFSDIFVGPLRQCQFSDHPPWRKRQWLNHWRRRISHSQHHASGNRQSTGTVFHFGGTTPAGGAVITLSDGHSATADSQGRYRIDLVPVGAYTVDATDPATGDRGRASAVDRQPGPGCHHQCHFDWRWQSNRNREGWRLDSSQRRSGQAG